MNKTQTGINTRELVVNMLMSISAGEEYSHVLLRSVLEKYDYLDGKEKAFMKRVTEGCLERRLELDYVLNGFSKTPVKKMKPFIRELLRMSTYQILYMSRVPDSAAINEAVKLARKKKFTGLSGFVNGVLRNIAREGKNYPLPDPVKEPVKYKSIRYSMPEWIVEKLEEDFGAEKAFRILEGLLEVRPLTVRFLRSVLQEEREQLLAKMAEQGVEAKQHPYLPEAFCLFHVEGVTELPGFADGKIAVQDISSMLAVEAAGIKAGDTVIDVCAAPGGKTAYAAMMAGPEGHVTARDVSDYKTSMIEENCSRLHISNVTVEVQDARQIDTAWENKADVVLADVPCLGLGVIGRKRDIKYRIQKEDIASITLLQKEIVTASVQMVKPGGVFLYSTCSMTREENADMVQWMTAELGLQTESIKEALPKEFLEKLTEEEMQSIRQGQMQLLPGIQESDGFFFARMRRM